MSYKRSVRYLFGGVAVIMGIFLMGFYYLFSGPAADAPPTPLAIRLLALPIGLPLIGVGVTLVRRRYQLLFYMLVATTFIYIFVPLYFDFFLFAIIITGISPIYIPYTISNYIPATITLLIALLTLVMRE